MKIRSVYVVRSTNGARWSSSVPYSNRHVSLTRKGAIEWAEANPYQYPQSVDPMKFVKHPSGNWHRLNSRPAEHDLKALLDKQFPADTPVQIAIPPCPTCNDIGEADSGGVYPWGAPVLIQCQCRSRAGAIDKLEHLIGFYWNIAYKEGQENRTTDTPEGSAAICYAAITEQLNLLRSL